MSQTEPAIEQEPIAARSLISEQYSPELFQVIAPEPGETPPGEPPTILLEAYVMPVDRAQNIYLSAKVAKIRARDAIALGEHLAAEGRKVLTGIAVPPAPHLIRP